MKHIYPPFFDYIRKHDLIQPEDTVIAAFSGGKDSLALLILLRQLSEEIPLKPIAAYFNHGLRRDASEEQAFVEDTCRSLDIRLVTGGENVAAFRKKHRLNLEHAASILRYRFLKEVARDFRARCIATGHTRSDLAETFLMKLFRGSGTRGLGSIFPRKDGLIIRPLLIFSQEDIREFLERNGIDCYQDHTNRDGSLLRNRIRLTLMPEIRSMEPNIEEHLFTSALLIQDEHDYFCRESKAFLKKHLILDRVLPLKPVGALHPALQRHVLREYIRLLKGDLLNIDFSHVENLLNPPGSARSHTLPGLDLRVRKDYLFPGNLSVRPYRYLLDSPGRVRLEEAGKTVTARRLETFRPPRSNFEIIAPLSSVSFPLTIRNPEREDSYVKINSGLSQRVFEMIRQSGMPAELRNLNPLILDSGNRPVWVAGSPIAESFRVVQGQKGPFLGISCR